MFANRPWHFPFAQYDSTSHVFVTSAASHGAPSARMVGHTAFDAVPTGGQLPTAQYCSSPHGSPARAGTSRLHVDVFLLQTEGNVHSLEVEHAAPSASGRAHVPAVHLSGATQPTAMSHVAPAIDAGAAHVCADEHARPSLQSFTFELHAPPASAYVGATQTRSSYEQTAPTTQPPSSQAPPRGTRATHFPQPSVDELGAQLKLAH